jgi:hypothetical protein
MRTDAGRDFMAGVMADTDSDGTGDYAPACFIGLSANSSALNAGDTSLTGEITTGTLDRVQATYGHTLGTDTYTLTHTFTSDQSVTIAKFAVFNAASGGTMVFQYLLDDEVVMVSGDQLQISQIITL